VSSLYDEDLALAQSCARGDAAAIARLDALLREEVSRAVRPIDPSLVVDATQRVRERLLVVDGTPAPRISEYRGEGPLRGWVRAIAVRTALNLRRGAPPAQTLPSGSGAPLAANDPELELFRARYREPFRQAFAAAVAGLTSRDRTVLRLHSLDGATLKSIGVMYGKDESTVSRWLEKIRLALRERTRSELSQKLSLAPGEVDSVLRAADLEVSVSLARLLAG
jgi:RNA polymerase sigma-70 factor (ECF subfamily)